MMDEKNRKEQMNRMEAVTEGRAPENRRDAAALARERLRRRREAARTGGYRQKSGKNRAEESAADEERLAIAGRLSDEQRLADTGRLTNTERNVKERLTEGVPAAETEEAADRPEDLGDEPFWKPDRAEGEEAPAGKISAAKEEAPAGKISAAKEEAPAGKTRSAKEDVIPAQMQAQEAAAEASAGEEPSTEEARVDAVDAEEPQTGEKPIAESIPAAETTPSVDKIPSVETMPRAETSPSVDTVPAAESIPSVVTVPTAVTTRSAESIQPADSAPPQDSQPEQPKPGDFAEDSAVAALEEPFYIEGNTMEQSSVSAEETAPSCVKEEPLIGQAGKDSEPEDMPGTATAPMTRRELKKREKEEVAALRKQEALEKLRRKREAKEERQRQAYEKKEARSVVRQERRQEWSSTLRTAEVVILLTFGLLAIDQVGVYGFLFVWLAIALAAASVGLLILGIVRGIRRKRCGIVFFIAIAGMILSIAWFIFLISERGLGVAFIQNNPAGASFL